jgi:hypothetical protein
LKGLLRPMPDKTRSSAQGWRPQRYLAAVEFVFLFTLRLVGNNAACWSAFDLRSTTAVANELLKL